jgi:signal transduction histidine kinase
MIRMTPAKVDTATRWTAVIVLAVALTFSLTAITLDVVAEGSGRVTPVAPGWAGVGRGLGMTVTGAILLWRLAWHPIAMILLFFGAAYSVDGLASAWVNFATVSWQDAPLVEAAFQVNQRFSGLALIAMPLVLVLFPTGKLPTGRIVRATAVVSICLSVVPILALTLMPWHELHARFGDPDPSVGRWWRGREWGLELPPGVWNAVAAAAMPALILGVVLSALVLLDRRRGADAELRHQLKWIVWAGALFSALFALGYTVLPYYIGQLAVIAGTTLVCVAILIAVSRYRLYSIDQLVSWTVVYAVLVAAVLLVDMVLIAFVGAFMGDQAIAIASVLLVFLAYAPLRERLLGWVGRLVNGTRGDPYGVVSSLAGRLEDATDPDDQLMHVARSVALAFASPYVAVQVEQPDGRRLVASHGWTSGQTVTMPLTYRRTHIGQLEMAPGRRAHLSRRDERLLGDVVRQAAAAVRATVLSQELQAIREQLVTAREEERHRLRRDLHDGLGPTLAGVQLRIEAARNLSRTDPAETDELLASAVDGITDAVADIRRLAHDLRPPALDDLGLARAVGQVCKRFSADGPGTVQVDYRHDVPDDLPAAIEVAVYRVVSEALVNVQRHALASRVEVRVFEDFEGSLIVEVADDGIGIDKDAPAGVGLRSMRERADELGGRLEVAERDGGGTLVRAVLPLPSQAREETASV